MDNVEFCESCAFACRITGRNGVYWCSLHRIVVSAHAHGCDDIQSIGGENERREPGNPGEDGLTTAANG